MFWSSFARTYVKSQRDCCWQHSVLFADVAIVRGIGDKKGAVIVSARCVCIVGAF